MDSYKEKAEMTLSVCNWSGKTILIAEDEEINFFYLKETLEDTGITIIHAEHGKHAVDICKANDGIDLVLMDIKMPVMDGFEATSQIKSIRKELPVIAQTAYAFTGEKRKSIEAGCDDFLSKPIKPNDLLKTIAKFLSCDQE